MLHDDVAMNGDNRPCGCRSLEDRLESIECKLDRLLDLEEDMAANESAETQALNDAIAGLQAELADVGSVDQEVVADLEGIKGAIEKVGPTTPEQVNAVTAVTAQLASLTGKLKAAGQSAAAVENPPALPTEETKTEAAAPPVEQAPPVETPAPAPPAESPAPVEGGAPAA